MVHIQVMELDNMGVHTLLVGYKEDLILVVELEHKMAHILVVVPKVEFTLVGHKVVQILPVELEHMEVYTLVVELKLVAMNKEDYTLI